MDYIVDVKQQHNTAQGFSQGNLKIYLFVHFCVLSPFAPVLISGKCKNERMGYDTLLSNDSVRHLVWLRLRRPTKSKLVLSAASGIHFLQSQPNLDSEHLH